MQTRSAGTASSARCRVALADIKWADLILVMERKHQQRLRTGFREALRYKEVVVLGIEDRWTFMHPRLVTMLRGAVDPILDHAIKHEGLRRDSSDAGWEGDDL